MTSGELRPMAAWLDIAPHALVAFDDDGIVLRVNDGLLAMLGMERDAVVGRSVEALMAVGSRIFHQTHFVPLLRLHGRAEEIFLLLRASDGAEVAVLAYAARAEARSGHAVTECALVRVRERRRFEEALLRAKRDAEEAREAADARGRELQLANDLLERQALELELSERQLQEQATELELQAEELSALNETLTTQAGELEQERAAAEEANRAKSAFLAMMSHELRTPLNAIGGYAQLLELGIHGPVTDAQQEAIGRILRSQRHLLRLVNEVLNLARIESGRVEYQVETVDVAELFAAVLPLVEPQIEARALRRTLALPDGLAVRADRDKLQQILLNLLSNAVKFTPRGGMVEVAAGVVPERADRVFVTVRDTGIGIPADRLGEVFEPFVQVDVSHASRTEGSGLGLAISRDLARGMDGDITVESTVGVGSTFRVLLPAVPAPDAR